MTKKNNNPSKKSGRYVGKSGAEIFHEMLLEEGVEVMGIL